MAETARITKEFPPGQLSRLFVSLGMVYEAGLPMSEAMEVLRESASSDAEARMLDALGKASADGIRLTEAFSQIGGLPPYALALLAVAEQTGTMSKTCQALTVYYDKRDRLAQAIRSSLVYPLAMMVMIFIVVVMLLTQAMPIFDQVFAQFGYEMSGMAQSLLGIGLWMRGAMLWLSGGAVALIVIGLLLSRIEPGRRFFSWVFEHNPLTGELSFKLSVQRLMLGLSAMLKSGMTPQAAMELAPDLVDDSRVKSRLTSLEAKLAEGLSFQKALTESDLLPKDSQLMVAIGFRTGSNAEAFERIGESIALSTERQMVSLVAAIEPMLVAVMTVIVGFILLSVMLPLLGVLATL